LFPQEKYKVVGIESSSIAEGPKGRMLIHGIGNKILNTEEELAAAGAYDLLFQDKDTKEYVMADMKNYGNPTAQDWQKWKVQQMLYAKALSDYGTPISATKIIEPYQNRTRTMAFTNDDISSNFANVQQVVELMKGLTNGNLTIDKIRSMSELANKLLFNKTEQHASDDLRQRMTN